MEKQPTDTAKNKHISDALYSSGGPVKVGLRDSSNNQPVTALDGSCPGTACVTASRSPGTGDPSSTLSGTTSKPLSGGVASFDDLSLDKTNPSDSSYKLDFAFTNPQVTSTTSGPFSIADAGQACTGGACSVPTAKFDSTGTNSVTTSNASTSFNTAGGLSLTFFTSGIPAAVTGPGGGCANFTPTDSAGVTLKVTGTTGAVSIGYGITAAALAKRYGPAYALAIAMPLIPICVGAQRVDAGGNRIPCESDGGVRGPVRRSVPMAIQRQVQAGRLRSRDAPVVERRAEHDRQADRAACPAVVPAGRTTDLDLHLRVLEHHASGWNGHPALHDQEAEPVGLLNAGLAGR